MKRYAFHILVGLNALLALTLLGLWLDGRANLRNIHWTPPPAVKPDLSAMLPALVRPGSGSSGLVATLERPLFSPSRRPPQLVAVAAAPPPDPLANIQLVGIYGGPGGGGIVARVDGKTRRAKTTDKIGEWTIARVADREVTFVRGAETRVIQLGRGKSPPITSR